MDLKGILPRKDFSSFSIYKGKMNDGFIGYIDQVRFVILTWSIYPTNPSFILQFPTINGITLVGRVPEM
jgi:hypothetical protein